MTDRTMPELPEVETVVSQLRDRLIGKTIQRIVVRKAKIFQGKPDDIGGVVITDVRRRAKIIVLTLDNGCRLLTHLKMTGQLVVGQTKAETVSFHQGIPFAGFSLPAKTTHVIIELSDDTKLFFNDNRQFGWMKLVGSDAWQGIDRALGPEPLTAAFTTESLETICRASGRSIKVILMDQSKIAGIGNIYANEALWHAGIHPAAPASALKKPQIAQLYRAIRRVLMLGIKHQGSSARDEAFVNALGEKGSMQHHFSVYQRQGKPCSRCKTPLVMIRLGGRGTFFCPVCQPLSSSSRISSSASDSEAKKHRNPS